MPEDAVWLYPAPVTNILYFIAAMVTHNISGNNGHNA